MAGPALAGVALWALATREAWPSSQVLTGADALQILLPLKQFLADQLHAGRLPTWYPYDGAGLSLPGSLLGGLLDPLNALLLALSPIQALKWMTLLSLPLAAAGLAYLARGLGLPRRVAAFSGIAYGLSGLAMSQTNTLTYLASISRIPWALGAALRLGRRPGRSSAAVLAIAWASLIWSGDPEEFLITGALSLGLLACGRAPAKGRVVAGLGVLALIAALTGAVLLPALHQALGSARALPLGTEEALSWSLHPVRLLELALGSPFDFAGTGRALAATYGGQNGGFWSGSLFMGSLLVLLAIVGLTARGARAWTWRAVALIGAVGAWLALGRFGGLYAQVPPLMHFRYPEKLEVWFVLPLALLAGRGLQGVVATRLPPRLLAGYAALLAIAGGAASTMAGVSFATGLFHALPVLTLALVLDRTLLFASRSQRGPLSRKRRRARVRERLGSLELPADRLPHPNPPSLREAQAVPLAGEVDSEPAQRAAGSASRAARFIFLAALALLEPALTNPSILEVGSAADTLPAISPVPEVQPDDRLCVDLAYRASHDHPEHWDHALRRLTEQATLDAGMTAAYRLRSVTQQIPLGTSALAKLCAVADVCSDTCSRLFGARWLWEPQDVADRLVATGQYHRIRDVADPAVSLLMDRLAAPYSAVLPAHPYADAWKTIVALHEHHLQPGAQALIAEGDVPNAASFTGRGLAPARRSRPDHIEVDTYADLPGILVVREGYSADWHATLDGVELHLIQADLGFLGVPVPSGHHAVVLEHRPWGWPGTLWLHALALLTCLALLASQPRRRQSSTRSAPSQPASSPTAAAS